MKGAGATAIGRALSLMALVLLAFVLGKAAARAPSYVDALRMRNAARRTWNTLSTRGSVLREGPGPTLVEVADYECPFCRSSHYAVDSLLSSDASIRFVFVNVPLDIHEHAREAAQAFLCGSAMDRAPALHRHLFTDLRWRRDGYNWRETAQTVGIPDAASFADCVSSKTYAPQVDTAIAWSKRMRLAGTPTFIASGGRIHVGRASVADLRVLLGS